MLSRNGKRRLNPKTERIRGYIHKLLNTEEGYMNTFLKFAVADGSPHAALLVFQPHVHG